MKRWIFACALGGAFVHGQSAEAVESNRGLFPVNAEHLDCRQSNLQWVTIATTAPSKPLLRLNAKLDDRQTCFETLLALLEAADSAGIDLPFTASQSIHYRTETKVIHCRTIGPRAQEYCTTSQREVPYEIVTYRVSFGGVTFVSDKNI